MCGIIGFFGEKLNKYFVLKEWKKIEHRGKDLFKCYVDGEYYTGKSIDEIKNKIPEEFNVFIGQNTHSIIGKPILPIEKNGVILVANAEIYNFDQLGNYENDTLALFDHKTDKIDGIFAFAKYFKEKKTLYLKRDIFGVNPLCYYFDGKTFSFCSEKLSSNYHILDPMYSIVYKNKRVYKIKNIEYYKKFKHWWNLKNFHRDYDLLEKTLINAINLQTKHIEDFCILFSGGVDSTFLAKVCQDLNKKFVCLCCGSENSEDVIYSKKIAKDFEFDLIWTPLKLTEEIIVDVLKIIKEPDVMKLSVAIPFYLASKQTNKKVCLSGLGSEEIFAGYERHVSNDPLEIHKKCVEGLREMWKRDLYRDNCILMYNRKELRVPYLDIKVVDCALKFDPKYRIYNGIKKYNFRKIAEKYIGEYAWRKKRAAQYGSGVMKQIEKLAKKRGFKYKKDYILTLFNSLKIL